MSHDFSLPYTEDELEGLKEIFNQLPTFKNEGYILSSDLPAVIENMEYKRTPEQVSAYKAYQDKHYGGILVLSRYIQSCCAIHDTSKMVILMAEPFDKNGEGYISGTDFEELLTLLIIHYPKLKGISVDNLLKESATNSHGKVSLEEVTNLVDDYLKRGE